MAPNVSVTQIQFQSEFSSLCHYFAGAPSLHPGHSVAQNDCIWFKEIQHCSPLFKRWQSTKNKVWRLGYDQLAIQQETKDHAEYSNWPCKLILT